MEKHSENNITLVFRGFLNLNAKEKLRLVESINEYFDSMNREPIRAANEAKFAEIEGDFLEKHCKCCKK